MHYSTLDMERGDMRVTTAILAGMASLALGFFAVVALVQEAAR